MGLGAVFAAEQALATSPVFALASPGLLGALALGAAGLAALVRLLSGRLRGTTLTAPACWSLASLAALGGCELAVDAWADPPSAWFEPLRFAAAMTTFAPLMAVLGAKRPQDRAWQFIVLTLVAILSQPSVEWLLFGGVQEIHPARIVFLAVLVLLGMGNGLGTRLWPAAALYGLGQLALLAPFFLDRDPTGGSFDWPLLGLAAIGGSHVLGLLTARSTNVKAAPYDRVWLEFRDAFGAVWSLRIQERINTAATLNGWPILLTWQGFRDRATGEPLATLPPAAVESLHALLRRFVSREWIDERLDRSVVDRPAALC